MKGHERAIQVEILPSYKEKLGSEIIELVKKYIPPQSIINIQKLIVGSCSSHSSDSEDLLKFKRY